MRTMKKSKHVNVNMLTSTYIQGLHHRALPSAGGCSAKAVGTADISILMTGAVSAPRYVVVLKFFSHRCVKVTE